MQKFVDRAGRIWIVDIDNTTLRRVKTSPACIFLKQSMVI